MPETITRFELKVSLNAVSNGGDGKTQRALIDYIANFTDGTSDGQIQKIYYDDSRSLNNTSEDLDLGAGGLTNFLGEDINGTALKVVLLQETSGSGTLTLKPGATNPMTTLQGGTNPTLVTGAGGFILVVNPVGVAISDGTADRLAVQTSGDQTYRVLIAVE